MCRIARAKARKTGLPVKVICADMRTFRLPAQVDLITCEFNSLNHVPRKSDLSRVARSAVRALRQGGHFFFDVHNRAAFEGPRNWMGETKSYLVLRRGGYDRRAEKGWLEFTTFAAQRNGMWKRSRERIEQVCWTALEIRRALQQAGFVNIRAFDESLFFPREVPPRRHCSTFFVAQK